MTTNPLVSVIVPNYNHARYLERRLDSIFEQTFQDFEVILLDDNSSDNSVEILSRYAKEERVSHLLINRKNSGSTFIQWKRGIKLAKGRYIWIAESDDWADIYFLETMIKSNAPIVFCRTNIFNEETKELFDVEKWLPIYSHGDLFGRNASIIGNDYIEKHYHKVNWILNASGVLFKKEVLNFNQWHYSNYKIVGDWFFWFDIIKNNEFQYINEPLNFNRISPQSVRKKKKDIEKEESLIFLEYYYAFLKANKLKTYLFLKSWFDWNFKDYYWSKKYKFDFYRVFSYFKLITINSVLVFMLRLITIKWHR